MANTGTLLGGKLRREPDPIENVTTYPETMRGGTWDKQTYAGSDEAALRHALAIVDRVGGMLRQDSPNWRTDRPQVWHDGWRHAWRVLRFRGLCVVCHRRTYAFDDGQNDPRGVLGDRAANEVTREDVAALPEGWYVPACFGCMNEEPRYRDALDIGADIARRVEVDGDTIRVRYTMRRERVDASD